MNIGQNSKRKARYIVPRREDRTIIFIKETGSKRRNRATASGMNNCQTSVASQKKSSYSSIPKIGRLAAQQGPKRRVELLQHQDMQYILVIGS